MKLILKHLKWMWRYKYLAISRVQMIKTCRDKWSLKKLRSRMWDQLLGITSILKVIYGTRWRLVKGSNRLQESYLRIILLKNYKKILPKSRIRKIVLWAHHSMLSKKLEKMNQMSCLNPLYTQIKNQYWSQINNYRWMKTFSTVKSQTLMKFKEK